jgi:hypothetical protein
MMLYVCDNGDAGINFQIMTLFGAEKDVAVLVDRKEIYETMCVGALPLAMSVVVLLFLKSKNNYYNYVEEKCSHVLFVFDVVDYTFIRGNMCCCALSIIPSCHTQVLVCYRQKLIDHIFEVYISSR